MKKFLTVFALLSISLQVNAHGKRGAEDDVRKETCVRQVLKERRQPRDGSAQYWDALLEAQANCGNPDFRREALERDNEAFQRKMHATLRLFEPHGANA